MRNTKIVTVTLPTALGERLLREAARRNVSISRIVSTSVARYFGMRLPEYQHRRRRKGGGKGD